MSQAPHRTLSADEITALQPVLAEARSNARTLLGIVTTFFVPIMSVMAFAALYPPFWNPSLAASSLAVAIGMSTLYGLWAYRIYLPVRRLSADLRAGQAEAHEGEVQSCRPADYFVAVTLADAPQTVLKLAPPVLGQDERRSLSVGQRIHVDLLPHSGRLLQLRRAG